jgi:cytochrome P450
MTDRPLAGAADAAFRLDARFFSDPDAVYQELRRERPVVKVTSPFGFDLWMVTRYEDVRTALTEPRLSKNSARFGEVLRRNGVSGSRRMPFGDALRTHMLNSDPPDHTRLRKLLSGAFTARAVARMRPRIEAIATELADGMAAKAPGTVDLLQEFAYPLPMTVICELLGVPPADRDRFRSWSTVLLSSEQSERRVQSGQAMEEYLVGLVAAKRASPGEDMLSSIVAASDDEDRLSEHEVISTAFLLLVAGHETTVNLIGNGVWQLLRHRDQLAALQADPSLIQNAVEEFLRIEGPVNLATIRFTAEPVEIGGQPIPAGDIVLVSLLSANLDPERFNDPADLDVGRDTSGHVAFGHGIHHCLGAPLARLEGEIAFRTLLQRFPQMTLAATPDPLVWRQSLLMHGLSALPVAV